MLDRTASSGDLSVMPQATWGMSAYDELKAEMEAIEQQMTEAKKNERIDTIKEVKRLCKEFGFTAGMLKGALAERVKINA